MPKKPQKPEKSAPANDLDVLKELVALLESSSATTIKLGRGDASYEVSRFPGMPFAAPPVHSIHAGPALQAPAAHPAAPHAAPSPEKTSNLTDIKSPMVGTFYRSPEPGADPYVKVGSRVAPGQTLCIIEAMKIMNEIESEVSGTIREVAVEDASPVEFGQVLYRVEPNV
ncbi:MAG TPA: acetyl-CoA carboxylase biotin carboxyl carrier protein [Gemmatimonadales bacterium]|jgi:acetyl-CoA carboxylase biotin carboxyl carrier protein